MWCLYFLDINLGTRVKGQGTRVKGQGTWAHRSLKLGTSELQNLRTLNPSPLTLNLIPPHTIFAPFLSKKFAFFETNFRLKSIAPTFGRKYCILARLKNQKFDLFLAKNAGNALFFVKKSSLICGKNEYFC